MQGRVVALKAQLLVKNTDNGNGGIRVWETLQTRLAALSGPTASLRQPDQIQQQLLPYNIGGITLGIVERIHRGIFTFPLRPGLHLHVFDTGKNIQGTKNDLSPSMGYNIKCGIDFRLMVCDAGYQRFTIL